MCALGCPDGELYYRTLKAWCVPWSKVPLAAFLSAWFAISKKRRAHLLAQEGQLYARELDVYQWLPNMLQRDDAAMLSVVLSGAVVRKRVVVQWIKDFLATERYSYCRRSSLGIACARRNAVRCLEMMYSTSSYSYTSSEGGYLLAECAAKHGRLALLEILDARHGSSIRADYGNAKAITFAAAEGGHLECLQFLRGKEYPWDAKKCISAAVAAPRLLQDWIEQNKTTKVFGDEEAWIDSRGGLHVGFVIHLPLPQL